MATLFEPTASPRVYGLPPGVDFPKALFEKPQIVQGCNWLT